MSEWIKVEERLPETHGTYTGGPFESKEVIIFDGESVFTGWYKQRKAGGKFYWQSPFWGNVFNITHWMPLPPKPEDI